MNKEEVKNMFITIKAECAKYNNCVDCTFYAKEIGNCIFSEIDYPGDLNIDDLENLKEV